MIDRLQYFRGRDETHQLAMSPQIERNAVILLDLTNRLLVLAKCGGVMLASLPGGGIVCDGWRPPAVNAATPGASKDSLHMTAQAIDLYDPMGTLGRWMIRSQRVLVDLGLWLQVPSKTAGWAHVQDKPSASGDRVFTP